VLRGAAPGINSEVESINSVARYRNVGRRAVERPLVQNQRMQCVGEAFNFGFAKINPMRETVVGAQRVKLKLTNTTPPAAGNRHDDIVSLMP